MFSFIHTILKYITPQKKDNIAKVGSVRHSKVVVPDRQKFTFQRKKPARRVPKLWRKMVRERHGFGYELQQRAASRQLVAMAKA